MATKEVLYKVIDQLVEKFEYRASVDPHQLYVLKQAWATDEKRHFLLFPSFILELAASSLILDISRTAAKIEYQTARVNFYRECNAQMLDHAEELIMNGSVKELREWKDELLKVGLILKAEEIEEALK